MFTPDDVGDLFDKREHPQERWLFTPKWSSSVKSYRYALSFLHSERRFVLSRQVISPFIAVDDEELLRSFRSQLSDDELAACMRAAISPPPEDDIPF